MANNFWEVRGKLWLILVLIFVVSIVDSGESEFSEFKGSRFERQSGTLILKDCSETSHRCSGDELECKRDAEKSTKCGQNGPCLEREYAECEKAEEKKIPPVCVTCSNEIAICENNVNTNCSSRTGSDRVQCVKDGFEECKNFDASSTPSSPPPNPDQHCIDLQFQNCVEMDAKIKVCESSRPDVVLNECRNGLNASELDCFTNQFKNCKDKNDILQFCEKNRKNPRVPCAGPTKTELLCQTGGFANCAEMNKFCQKYEFKNCNEMGTMIENCKQTHTEAECTNKTKTDMDCLIEGYVDCSEKEKLIANCNKTLPNCAKQDKETLECINGKYVGCEYEGTKVCQKDDHCNGWAQTIHLSSINVCHNNLCILKSDVPVPVPATIPVIPVTSPTVPATAPSLPATTSRIQTTITSMSTNQCNPPCRSDEICERGVCVLSIPPDSTPSPTLVPVPAPSTVPQPSPNPGPQTLAPPSPILPTKPSESTLDDDDDGLPSQSPLQKWTSDFSCKPETEESEKFCGSLCEVLRRAVAPKSVDNTKEIIVGILALILTFANVALFLYRRSQAKKKKEKNEKEKKKMKEKNIPRGPVKRGYANKADYPALKPPEKKTVQESKAEKSGEEAPSPPSPPNKMHAKLLKTQADLAKLRAHVKKRAAEHKSDTRSDKFQKKGPIFIPMEPDLPPPAVLPDNVVLDKVSYDPSQNEMFDIGSDVDDIEMDSSLVLDPSTLTEEETTAPSKKDQKSSAKPPAKK